jgi:glucose-6-phosphate isomerase
MTKMILDYNYASSSSIACGVSDESLLQQVEKAKRGMAKLNDMVKEKKVGFPNLPYQDVTNIKGFAKEIYKKYNDLVVIGIGGSALGFESVVNALLPHGYNSLSFADRKGYPRYWLLDNADPALASSVMKFCNPEDTFVLVISKSGSTVETAANFALIYEWMKSKSVDLKKHIAVVTDPSKGPLYDLSQDKGLPNFPLGNDIGGRFSVLSSVGLLPAAILGIDIERMLKGAATVVESDHRQLFAMAGVYMHYLDQKRPINILMPYSSRLNKFAEWYCQLWGESLGKRYTTDNREIYFGNTPVKAVGAVDQHSQLQLYREGPDDKFITFIELAAHDNEKTLNGSFHPVFEYLTGHKMGALLNAELHATEAALSLSGRPSMRLELNLLDEAGLGQLFMLFQYVTAIIGLSNDIDPFDQPGVEEGKDFAYGLMGRKGYDGKKKQFDELYVKHKQYII